MYLYVNLGCKVEFSIIESNSIRTWMVFNIQKNCVGFHTNVYFVTNLEETTVTLADFMSGFK